jgi:CRISPR system Cascade subunit CasB
LRSGLGREAGTVPALWRYYTCEVDDRAARRGEVSAEQAAEHAALALYGLHQQAKNAPMHRPGVPLGRALRKLHVGGRFSRQAVDATVTAAATTTSVPALLIRLRGLVTMLRAVDQPLDYDQLMRLILDWRHADDRRRARRAWAVQYQVWVPEAAHPDDRTPTGAPEHPAEEAAAS